MVFAGEQSKHPTLEPRTFSAVLVFVPLCVWALAKFVNWGLERYCTPYRMSNEHQQASMVIYFLEVIVTSVVVALQLSSIEIFWDDEPSQEVLDRLYIAMHIVFGLYIFELAYQKSIRYSLEAHHLAAIGFMITMLINLETHPSIDVFRGMLCELTTATTEQLTFLGMILYRLDVEWAPTLLKFASIQSLLFKLGLFGLCVYYLIKVDMERYTLIVSIWFVVLLPPQIFGSYAVWKVGVHAHEKVEQKHHHDHVHDAIDIPSTKERTSIEMTTRSQSSIDSVPDE